MALEGEVVKGEGRGGNKRARCGAWGGRSFAPDTCTPSRRRHCGATHLRGAKTEPWVGRAVCGVKASNMDRASEQVGADSRWANGNGAAHG